MFNKIQNPETGNWVNTNGPTGRRVLRNYVRQFGGAGDGPDAGEAAGTGENKRRSLFGNIRQGIADKYAMRNKQKATKKAEAVIALVKEDKHKVYKKDREELNEIDYLEAALQGDDVEDIKNKTKVLREAAYAKASSIKNARLKSGDSLGAQQAAIAASEALGESKNLQRQSANAIKKTAEEREFDKQQREIDEQQKQMDKIRIDDLVSDLLSNDEPAWKSRHSLRLLPPNELPMMGYKDSGAAADNVFNAYVDKLRAKKAKAEAQLAECTTKRLDGFKQIDNLTFL